MTYEECRELELESIGLLLPIIKPRFDKLVEVTDKLQQEYFGDYIGIKNQRAYYIEFKCENKYTGNFFMETWSNYGHNKGWFIKCRADYLVYHFLDVDKHFIIDYQKAKEHINNNKYFEATQNKNKQKNIAKGLLVPIEDLKPFYK